MAYLVLVINSSKDGIADLNSKCQNATNPHEAIERCRNYLDSILSGNPCTVQVTSRDTDPAVGTHGTGSDQESYNLS